MLGILVASEGVDGNLRLPISAMANRVKAGKLTVFQSIPNGVAAASEQSRAENEQCWPWSDATKLRVNEMPDSSSRYC